MIQRGMIQHVQCGVYGSDLGIIRAVDEALNARMYHRSRTHRAWLDGGKKLAIA
jgi:hypothetical protein